MAKKVVDKEKLAKVTKKGKGFMGEFKEFIMRGNVMDMAVGVIIGGANGIGGAEVGGTLKIYGGQVIKYGDFITAIINFLIMALVLFFILKGFNKLASLGKKEAEEAVAPKTDEAILLEEIRDLLKKRK